MWLCYLYMCVFMLSLHVCVYATSTGVCLSVVGADVDTSERATHPRVWHR